MTAKTVTAKTTSGQNRAIGHLLLRHVAPGIALSVVAVTFVPAAGQAAAALAALGAMLQG
jgi:hypothetical protein